MALMVYVSTRIKKSAAAAFAREDITTKTFSFTKPEGFICVSERLSPEACFIHSPGFGETEAAESAYQAEGRLSRHSRPFDDVKSESVAEGGFAVEDVRSNDCIVRGVISDNGVDFKIFRRLIQGADGKTWDFNVKVLTGNLDEYQAKADEIVSSFRIR